MPAEADKLTAVKRQLEKRGNIDRAMQQFHAIADPIEQAGVWWNVHGSRARTMVACDNMERTMLGPWNDHWPEF